MTIQQTNIVSKDDYNKIQNMVRREMNIDGTLHHPDVIEIDDGFQINGIAHLSEKRLHIEVFRARKNVLQEIIDSVYATPVPTKKVKLKSVQISANQDELVYDIAMNNPNHNFFANDVLVHNTDSVYFSIQKLLNEQGDNTELSKEDVIDLYTHVANEVDVTFASFMNETFNTGIEKGKIIAAGLEIVGTRGLFLKKKRYGILLFWKDGFRKDINGKAGSLKPMGIEIKRSDTPKYIQKHLEHVFTELLKGADEATLRSYILDFKREFKSTDPWVKGSPRTVKNLINKTEIWKKTGVCSTGHVLAAINWNELCDFFNDKISGKIANGGKVVVVKLRANEHGMKSIAYPSDHIDKLPQWFIDLPFDEELMEASVLTKKLNNLFGTIDMDLGLNADTNNSFNNQELFGW